MNKTILTAVLAGVMVSCPLIAGAQNWGIHPSKSHPFMGGQKNIKWVAHIPEILKDPQEEKDMEATLTDPDPEADYRGQTDVGKIDLYGDSKEETIKAIWGGGVSDRSLTIEVYKDNKLISTLKNDLGIQANYKIEDFYHDGRKEIIIWSGLWDFRLPGEDGLTDKTYEGHSEPHRQIVEIYRPIKGNEFRPDDYTLWDVYTTKKKYHPFCEEMPVRD